MSRKWRNDQLGMRFIDPDSKVIELDHDGDDLIPSQCVLVHDTHGHHYSVYAEESNYPALVLNIRGEGLDVDVVIENNRVNVVLTQGRKQKFVCMEGLDEITYSRNRIG